MQRFSIMDASKFGNLQRGGNKIYRISPSSPSSPSSSSSNPPFLREPSRWSFLCLLCLLSLSDSGVYACCQGTSENSYFFSFVLITSRLKVHIIWDRIKVLFLIFTVTSTSAWLLWLFFFILVRTDIISWTMMPPPMLSLFVFFSFFLLFMAVAVILIYIFTLCFILLRPFLRLLLFLPLFFFLSFFLLLGLHVQEDRKGRGWRGK